MSVPELPVTTLDDDELRDLGDRLSGAIERLNGGDPWFAPLAVDVRTQITDMNVSLGRDTKSPLTPEIIAADRTRDQAYITYRNGLEFWESVKDEAKSSAAGRLMKLLRDREYYSLQNFSNDDQSVAQRTVFQDLDNTQAVADIAALAFESIVGDMQTEQANFDALVAERAASDPDAGVPSLTSVRNFLREDLSVVRLSLKSLERRNPAGNEALIQEASQHITEIVAKARTRRSRGAAEEETTPTGDE